MSFDRELKALCDEVQGARSAMVMSFDGISVAGHQAREGDLDTEALFYLPTPFDPLRITEIMYHPREGDLIDGDAYEFLAGMDARGQPRWTRAISSRTAVFEHRDACLRSDRDARLTCR